VRQLTEAWHANYIWHKEPFDLAVVLPEPVGGASAPVAWSPRAVPRLQGSTVIGDSLADEWFIVAMLVHISREVPDVAITYVVFSWKATKTVVVPHTRR